MEIDRLTSPERIPSIEELRVRMPETVASHRRSGFEQSNLILPAWLGRLRNVLPSVAARNGPGVAFDRRTRGTPRPAIEKVSGPRLPDMAFGALPLQRDEGISISLRKTLPSALTREGLEVTEVSLPLPPSHAAFASRPRAIAAIIDRRGSCAIRLRRGSSRRNVSFRKDRRCSAGHLGCAVAGHPSSAPACSWPCAPRARP